MHACMHVIVQCEWAECYVLLLNAFPHQFWVQLSESAVWPSPNNPTLSPPSRLLYAANRWKIYDENGNLLFLQRKYVQARRLPGTLVRLIPRLGVIDGPQAVSWVLDTPQWLERLGRDLFRQHPEPVFVDPRQRLNVSQRVLFLVRSIPQFRGAVFRVATPEYLEMSSEEMKYVSTSMSSSATKIRLTILFLYLCSSRCARP